MRRLFEAGKISNEPGPENRPSRPSYRLAVKGWDATAGVHTKDGEPHDDDAPAPPPTAKKTASSVAPITAWEMDQLKTRGFLPDDLFGMSPERARAILADPERNKLTEI